MPNRLITLDEAAESIYNIIIKAGDKYQKESGCTDKQREDFQVACAMGVHHSINKFN